MFGHRIKVDSDLWARLGQAARAAGYSSTEEFVAHVLDKAVASLEEAQSEEEIRKRLQGLGYLDQTPQAP